MCTYGRRMLRLVIMIIPALMFISILVILTRSNTVQLNRCTIYLMITLILPQIYLPVMYVIFGMVWYFS